MSSDELGDDHPLAWMRTMKLTSATGEVQFVTTDGRVLTGHVAAQSGPTAIASQTFDVQTSTLRMTLADGSVFTSQIGTVDEKASVPVVYLDQNHWIDLARVLTGAPSISGAQQAALEQLIELARNGSILLPLSGAHLVETAKKGSRQRTDLARTMVELSHGWQMRSPLRVRADELAHMFADPRALDHDEQRPRLDVFTLTPEALWADRYHSQPRSLFPHDLPTELAGLVDRIIWAASIADVLLDTDPEVSAPGVKSATAWAASFHELALHMRSNPAAKPYLRDLTRTRMITDMGEDVPRAALQAGLSPEQFAIWLKQDAERALSSTPALGRIREVIHLRLINADDLWHPNDLNDVLFLATAAGYADFVVGEKKTCEYLRRVQGRVPAGARVHRRAVDAVPEIVAAARA